MAADRFQYGYDQDSNVLYKNNLVFSLATELYHHNGTGNGLGYDALNRMVSFTRGTLTASAGTLDTVTVANQDTNLPQHTETWNLDALGNWTGSSAIAIDGTNQSRTVDSRNRYTAVGGATVTPDNIGNITQDETGLKYVYDIWNRVVKVENSSGGVLETYTYDSFGRRITETPNGQTTKDLYFDGSKVIEEQQAGTTTTQYVWGLGFVNSLVLRDDNSTSGSYGKSNSGLGRRVFVEQDADWNVASLVDTSGNVQERFVYDPYGRVQVVDKSTWNSSTDSFSWLYHFQGGRQDPVSGLVHFGTRDYSTTLGRWTEPDRGYLDGSNLYQADGSNPVAMVDPGGTDSQPIAEGSGGALPPPAPPNSTAPVFDHITKGGSAQKSPSSKGASADSGDAWSGGSWLAPGEHTYVEFNLPFGLSFGNMPSDFPFRASNAWAEYLHTAVYVDDGSSSSTSSSSGGGGSGGFLAGAPPLLLAAIAAQTEASPEEAAYPPLLVGAWATLGVAVAAWEIYNLAHPHTCFTTRPGDLPAQHGPPNGSLVKDDGRGNGQIRDYGPDGRAVKDIDFGHDHTKPPCGDPHAHDWDWSKPEPRQPPRPLKPGE